MSFIWRIKEIVKERRGLLIRLIERRKYRLRRSRWRPYCRKCSGQGSIFGYELYVGSDEFQSDPSKVPCDLCGGTGNLTEPV